MPDVIEATDGVLGLHRDRRFLPLVRSPVYEHGGVLVAADAGTKDGGGAHVGGMGEDSTKEAIEGSRSKCGRQVNALAYRH